ncbi:hypothetical protein DLM75_06835 [Leptospira stimsonii]|uniref:Uncharacterized protein n=1 Tax=Leptospira stimsonii TaxID=2202203 RepID=A0A396ZF35_9LEPT|nr:hypothetical protein DLM75_06835 [Leptospira stimsonii]
MGTPSVSIPRKLPSTAKVGTHTFLFRKRIIRNPETKFRIQKFDLRILKVGTLGFFPKSSFSGFTKSRNSHVSFFRKILPRAKCDIDRPCFQRSGLRHHFEKTLINVNFGK